MAREDRIVGVVRPLDDIRLGNRAGEDGSADSAIADTPTVDTDDALDEYLLDEPADEPRRMFGSTAVMAAGVVLASLGLIWTGFIAWANVATLQDGLTAQESVSLIVSWVTPLSLIALFWLTALRTSRAEAGRFTNTALSMQREGAALEHQLRVINGELSIARTFLGEQAVALESLGRQTADRFSGQGREIEHALSASEDKARTLNEVSSAALTNLEQLRAQLPVITAAAKDATNQIANAGRTAHGQISEVATMFGTMESAAQALRGELGAVSELATDSMQTLTVEHERTGATFAANLDQNSRQMRTLSEEMDARAVLAAQRLDAARSIIARTTEETLTQLQTAVADLDGGFAAFSGLAASEQQRLGALLAAVTTAAQDSENRLVGLEATGQRVATQFEAVFADLEQRSSGFAAMLADGEAQAAMLSERIGALESALEDRRQTLAESLPAALREIDSAVTQLSNRLGEDGATVQSISADSDRLVANLDRAHSHLSGQASALDELLTHGERGLGDQAVRVDQLLTAIAAMRSNAEDAAKVTDDALRVAVAGLEDAANRTASDIRERLQTAINDALELLNATGGETLDRLLDARVSQAGATLSHNIDAALNASAGNTDQLEARMARMAEMTSNLEARIAHARSGFDGVGDEGFTRRMALLTESLKSTSIDIAKIFSNDVTDTAWAAYLKGDRGIFTRRAVRLLDNAEAREITEHYEADSEFRAQVNRYIHDFEAMVRNLLSTRDGHAISVTLLSSDVGKLYVALAQAIDRLRS